MEDKNKKEVELDKVDMNSPIVDEENDAEKEEVIDLIVENPEAEEDLIDEPIKKPNPKETSTF